MFYSFTKRQFSLLALLFIPLMFLANIEIGAATSREELSLGKFYSFAPTPAESYMDARGNEFTAGTKLTDEDRGIVYPMTEWVAWSYTDATTITIDLGRNYPIEEATIGLRSHTDWGIYYPQAVKVETSPNGATWSTFAETDNLPQDTVEYSTTDLRVTGNRNGRFVRFVFSLDYPDFLFVDEIRVWGLYTDTAKHVPPAGCMHGAFPISTDNPYMNIANFETLAKKTIRMVLWYADWKVDFESSIGYLYDLVLGGRLLEVGWLPEFTTAESIAKGSHDAFLKKWLTDCAKRNEKIWLRPMNEFNGSWTFYNSTTTNGRYGGNPKEFRRAWRRMYNIAEQVGATGDNQIFVWSPNLPSYPQTQENRFQAYYPGHNYVDWVGASCYNNGTTPVTLLDAWYNEYATRKPLMIVEGGSTEEYTATPKPQWTTALYEALQTKYPQIKAMIWFNPQGGGADQSDLRIDSSQKALEAYQKAIAPSYFLDFNASIDEWKNFDNYE